MGDVPHALTAALGWASSSAHTHFYNGILDFFVKSEHVPVILLVNNSVVHFQGRVVARKGFCFEVVFVLCIILAFDALSKKKKKCNTHTCVIASPSFIQSLPTDSSGLAC